ncbi:uncharacterized protein LOC134726470 [Mytilus trossulus]|uniref:uncharacterized protein LOC134726470 n=1 Tax=Mytilus trossulus TaxID=6551 RepID=UPI0030058EAC
MQIENLPLKESIDKFYEIESLGISCTPKCGNCKCGKCPIGNNNYTIQDERELIMIRNGLNYDSESQKWEASYPWKRSPSELPNNVNSAKAKLLSTEKRLHKMGKEYSESYQNQIEDMVKRNVARKLTEKEIQQYEGPVHYIHHHEVLKPESKSTPIRIVFNSSASYMGHVLNEYWAKGPNVINDLLGVLLRFRQERVATAGDISKMYNSVNLSLLDQHTHRFVWRDMDSSKLPDHYVLQTVTFGDKPSGAIATIALQMTADMCSHTYPDTAQMINKNSYVDDILVSKETMKEAKNLIQNCDNILHKGGFAIKHWIVSGDSNDEMEGLNVVRTDEEKILGMIWQPMSDTFTLKIKLNFSPKRKGVRTGFNLNVQQIDDIPQNLTRRTVLSQVSSIYDPLGLVTPYILSAKLLMRSMCTKSDIGWDTPLDEQLITTWIEFFRGLFELENIKVPRRLKPEFTIGSPTLVIFSDASQVAYGACAYVRWQTGNNYETRLLYSKNRIAPTKQLSIPRLELCAAILAARMRQKIIQEMDWEFVKVIHITDSMIVRAQIQKESYGFGTFVATRVAEIQSITDPTDWYWIQGNLNPADLVTRPTQPDILDENSVWQRGPEFMRESIDCWPTRQDSTIESKQLPDVVSVTLCIDKRHVKIAPTLIDIDISRFSRLEKLLRVTALVLSIIKKKTFRGTFHTLNTKSIKQAEHVWVKEAQGEITETFMTLFQRLGPYKRQDGIIVVGQRMADWIKESWNQTEFVLIPSKHPLANLIVQSVHNEDHGGIDSTLAKIRSRFWIPGVRRTIKQIKEKCVTCRKRNKTTLTQQMGKLPSYRLNPSPPFYYCAVDLFGPYTIRDTVKRRTFGKAYGVIFNCLTSRGVYVDLVEGYDKNSFLIALRRFVSIRGYPRMMISDAGTQLVAAGKELKQVVHTWDWDDIKTFGTSKGMQWNIIKSADAPWENGCSEALIKSVKKCLDVAIGDSVMTFSELQTILFETANVLNERPIGTKNCDPNEGTYLCPNDLLLGRASIRVPNGHYNQDCNPRNRHAFIQNVVNSFWRKWIRDYFHTLIIRQKWHTSYRNLKKGDLVLVQDSNALRGKWKLGQVDEAIPSLDGNVRDVTVRYKNIGGSGTDYQNVTDTKIRRSVHRLVLLLPVEKQTNVTV